MSEAWGALARAKHLVELQRWDAALEALQPAYADDGCRAEAWAVRTQALIGKGDLTHALPAARQTIALRPEDEWGHRLLALVLQRGENHKDALRAAKEAARLAPDQPETLHVLALCQLNRWKRRDAQHTADQMVRTHPHNPISHLTVGFVAMARRNWPRAESALREVLRLDPGDAEAAGALSDVLKRTGRKAEAGEVLLAAGRADPTNKNVRESLGRLGLPIAGIGLFGGLKLLASFKLVGLLQLARLADRVSPLAAVVVAAVFFVVVGGYYSWARWNGTRSLPDHVHQGLVGEHRNYALAWLGSAGAVSLGLAGFAAAVPAERGGSAALAACLVAFGVIALGAVVALWTGPRPSLVPKAPGWLRRLRRS